MGFSGGGFSPLHLGTGFAKGGKGEMFGISTNALKLGSTLSKRWELIFPPALLILEPRRRRRNPPNHLISLTKVRREEEERGGGKEAKRTVLSDRRRRGP